jgi:uncharacterized protein affecting Mg2+/Co2+ transport
MKTFDLSHYISQVDDIAIAIKPTYLSKANDMTKVESFVSDSKKWSRDFFVWSYKIMITNDSKNQLDLIKYELKTISEDGIIRIITEDQCKSNLINGNVSINSGSVFESNEVIVMMSRSGIIYGECIFTDRKSKAKVIIKISPISLDSEDSKRMAN